MRATLQIKKIATTMKRLLLGVVALVCTMLLTAQVMPTPNPIPVGYKGEVVITFDPTAGNGGMIGAIEKRSRYERFRYMSAT